MPDLLSQITDKKRLLFLLSEIDQGQARRIDERELRESLSARVRGQDHVIQELGRVIRLQWGKQKRDKPIANLLFLGPTGTGKTELAKALAEYLFGDEKSMLRFDCAELVGSESKHHLIGNPTGYVGAETGGKLTRPMMNNSRRLVLFDEVEKACSDVFDLFLSIMGEGRLTEQGSGKLVDFTQAILVLTSNKEAEAVARIDEQVADPHEKTDAIKKHLAACGLFRPEICGRFDRVFIFRPLDTMVTAEVAAIKMSKTARAYGLELDHVDPELIVEALGRARKLKDFGMRELERVIDEQLGEALLMAREVGARRVRVEVAPDGALAVIPVGSREGLERPPTKPRPGSLSAS